MDYLSFMNGELRRKKLHQYINQGSSGANQIAVLVREVTSLNQEDYTAHMLFTLPNNETIQIAGIWTPEVYDDGGQKYDGYLFTLTWEVSEYPGAVLTAVRIVNTVNSTILVNYPFTLIINKTGVKNTSGTGVSVEQLDSYLSLVQNWIDNASEEFGTKLYVHHFDIVLTDNDLDMLPSGYGVSINVNAISNDPNEWATLSELDGKGYIVSAFGTISIPVTDYSYIFELKLFYSALNNGTLLINVSMIANGTVNCITVSNKNDYALEDSVSAVN